MAATSKSGAWSALPGERMMGKQASLAVGFLVQLRWQWQAIALVVCAVLVLVDVRAGI
ncbi:MAG TPA: hypothetical protein VEX13_07845 [Chloroflexia bacterium]|nr:hypothetical protein [Chloroflexia bacterium]